MKKLLLAILVLSMFSIVFSSCTEEEIKPKADNSTGAKVSEKL